MNIISNKAIYHSMELILWIKINKRDSSFESVKVTVVVQLISH